MANLRRKSITILWGMLGLAALLLVVAKIENRPPTSVRGPLKILTPPFTANKAELIQELRDRKFQQLDTQLNSYQKAFEENVLEEGNLAIAFDTFSFTDPALTPIMEEWIKNEPSSYPAHLARAEHLLALGWQARGDRYTDKTSEQQFNEMQNLFGEGVKEAIAAIKLNPKSSIGYALIIDAAKGAGSGDGLRRAYAAGIDLNRANRLRPQNPKVLESLAYVYEGLTRPKDTLAVIEQYRQIAQPDPYLLNIEKWAQNFGTGTAPPVKVGGN